MCLIFVRAAGRKTLDSVGAADNIIEALDMAAHEMDRQKESGRGSDKGAGSSGKAAPPNPLMLGLSPSAYVLRSVSLLPLPHSPE